MTREEFNQQMQKRGLTDIAVKAGVIAQSLTDKTLEEFISADPEVSIIKDKVRILAPTNLPVLIIGETGTGKELIARALHGNRQGNFVSVNCAGIPDTLLEAEFFGCVKGAYTGAWQDRIGYIKEAENGTLFLDEIGDMPLLMQCKLLRVLQDKKYHRIGSSTEETTTFRIVAATNKFNLNSSPTFREDLYYRIAGETLQIPPLRNRLNDIELIIKKFAKSDKAIQQSILDCKLPPQHLLSGNVRQLLNIIERNNVYFP